MAYSEESAAKFDAPVYLGGMFAGDDSSSDDEGASNGMVSRKENRLDASAGRQIDAAGMRFEVTDQSFPNMTMRIRQFDDHHRNANICWPEARCLAQWLVGEHLFTEEAASGVAPSVAAASSSSSAAAPAAPVPASASSASSASSANDRRRERFDRMLIGFPSGLPLPAAPVAAAPAPPLPAPVCSSCGCVRRPKRVLELGAATGALAIFLSALGVDMHTSDIADDAVRDNIVFNYALNGLAPVVHLSHSWGERLEQLDDYVAQHGAPDVILGSDILAYEDDFEKLANTICKLMPEPLTKATPGAEGESASAAAAACPSASAAAAAASSCPVCTSSSMLYMCWKRSHDKSLLDGGFWKLLAQRGFRIETRGNKTYEIRRQTKQEAEQAKMLPEGQFVHFVGSAANTTAGKPERKQKMKPAEKSAQNKAK